MGELIGVATSKNDGLMSFRRINCRFGMVAISVGWYKIFSSEQNGYYCLVIDAYRHKRETASFDKRKVLIQLDGYKTVVMEGSATDLIGYTIQGKLIDIYIKSNNSNSNTHLIADISSSDYINEVSNMAIDSTEFITTEPSGIIYI